MPLFLLLQYVQVFVVNYFLDFPEFFWIEGWVGGVYRMQTFLDFYIYILIYKVPKSTTAKSFKCTHLVQAPDEVVDAAAVSDIHRHVVVFQVS